MSEDTKKLRKVARCLQTILEIDGTQVTSKEIMEMIKDDDLNDIDGLKGKVIEVVSNREDGGLSKSSRRDAIREFVVANWSVVRDNKTVRSLLFRNYCLGRYTHDQKVVLLQELKTAVEEQVVAE